MWLSALVVSIALLVLYAFSELHHHFGRRRPMKRVLAVAAAMAVNIILLFSIDTSLRYEDVRTMIIIVESIAFAGLLWLCTPRRIRLILEYRIGKVFFRKKRQRQLWLWPRHPSW